MVNTFKSIFQSSHDKRGLGFKDPKFDALEEPSGAVTVDISEPLEVIVQKIRVSLGI